MKKNFFASEAKELLISIIGTAIGLGLTFAVDRSVENNKQQRAQRETALMAVCDIDEIMQGIREEIHLEDSLFNVAMYISTHQEQIETMSDDSLNMAFKYLYDNPAEVKEWTIDTKENAFNSSMEARKNLGNNKFYDNVLSCYYIRRSLMKTMEKTLMFSRPLKSEMYEEFMQSLSDVDMDENGNPALQAKRWLIHKTFEQGATRLYIRRYFSRRDAFLGAVLQLESLNRENKLLMNLSAQDIEEYIRKNEAAAQAATAELLVGTWEETRDANGWIHVFRPDGTIETTHHLTVSMRMFLTVEKMDVLTSMPIIFRMKGRWELKGDSLKTEYDGQTMELLSLDLDTSSFPQVALERLKDSLDIKKQEAKKFIVESIKSQASTCNRHCAIKFDGSGNTMVQSGLTGGSSGKQETFTTQLYRKE